MYRRWISLTKCVTQPARDRYHCTCMNQAARVCIGG